MVAGFSCASCEGQWNSYVEVPLSSAFKSLLGLVFASHFQHHRPSPGADHFVLGFLKAKPF